MNQFFLCAFCCAASQNEVKHVFQALRAFHCSQVCSSLFRSTLDVKPPSNCCLLDGGRSTVSGKGNILELKGLLVWPEGNITTKSNYPYWLWGNKRLNWFAALNHVYRHSEDNMKLFCLSASTHQVPLIFELWVVGHLEDIPLFPPFWHLLLGPQHLRQKYRLLEQAWRGCSAERSIIWTCEKTNVMSSQINMSERTGVNTGKLEAHGYC